MTSLILLVAFQLQSPPDPARPATGADACAEGRISHVFIDNHSIFDAASMPDDGWLRWSYGVANTIHMRTRADFIEAQLLFSEGDCYDPELVRESARILRDFRFIAGADAYGVEQPDGTVHVVVDTHDEWTTKGTLAIRFDEGFRFDGAGLVEENFLGRGIALGAYYTKREERRDIGMGLELPRIGHSRWDALVSAAATRVGMRGRGLLTRPFVAEREGTAWRLDVRHREDYFNYVLPQGEPLSHVVVPVQEERWNAAVARRIGEPGGLLVLGGGVSWERVGTGTVSRVEGVRDGDFDDRVPVETEVSREMEDHLRSRQALRLNFLAGVRRIRFVERSGLDAVRGVQDLPLGPEVLLSLGPSLGSTGLQDAPDLFTRADLFHGASFGSGLHFLNLSVEGRRVSGDAWRDVLGELRSLTYRRTERLGGPVLVLRGSAHGGVRTGSPFQLVLGGPDGVRGYPDTAYPGGRRAVVSAESRWALPGPFRELGDLGVTAFGDAGRIWAGDAPFGVDSGWRASVGAGLRIGFPAESSSVVRIDVAMPVDGRGSRRPVLRISAREWIGILNDARNPQLQRSRWSGMSSDFTGIAREPRPPG